MENEIVSKLKNIIIFNDFKDDEEKLLKFSLIMKKEKFVAKDYIIKEGNVGDKLYILNKGSVKILRHTLNNEEYTVAIYNDKENIFFGEVGLVDNERRSASVIAETECEVFSVGRKDFLTLCEEDTLMGYKVILQIAKRISSTLRKMNRDVIILFEALVNEVNGEL
ncbi:MAG: Crp/Fnr family transcriptional regulator [Spirochaetes bacterium GWD1_27_9]|nr:MAG: Crp/Fnr family transcriptional regulator [Spirochaetes bacterium GWB1_27_13]OHD21833.1 MAG: Crp/Fnr family transcriptional regulator [Spirochaetes bacterium GWC1_27_15]OHD30029.1 MAG: Crp/Fnr family transcriptional regulator [Spirochaetes bacterium GWD1_27_9]